MNGPFEKDLSEFSRELGDYINGIGMENKVKNILINLEKNCFENSMEDPEKFVNCMLKSTKKIEKEQSRFEFKMVFFQNKVVQCFQNASKEKKSLVDCKTKGKADLQQVVDDFLKGLNSL